MENKDVFTEELHELEDLAEIQSLNNEQMPRRSFVQCALNQCLEEEEEYRLKRK